MPPESASGDEHRSPPLSQLRRFRRLGAHLVASHTVDEAARAAMTDGIAAAGATGGSLMIVQGTRLQLISERNIADGVAEAWSDFDISPTKDPISDAVALQTSAFFPDRDHFLDAYPHLHDTIASTHHHAWAVLPLVHEGQTIGTLGFTFDQPRDFAIAEQLALCNIADLVRPAIVRAVSAAEEGEAFSSLNSALLDLDVPVLRGVMTATAHSTAATTSEAGGDWFNANELTDGRLLFVIGDVAHHGAAAVGEMGRIRATVFAYAVEGHPTDRIAELTTLTMSKLNSTFATACIMIFEPATRELTWTNAGHPYPVVVPVSGTPRLLDDTHGPPLGVDVETRYQRSSLVLDRGDTVVLYSDGLIERREHDLHEDFERLLETIPLDAPRPAGLVEQLLDRLHPSGLHDDDIAVLAVTVD
jgi:serine phosphatase RsbU (regulator of sigma subunit)